jgi:hypothetical protein
VQAQGEAGAGYLLSKDGDEQAGMGSSKSERYRTEDGSE